jgi:hypothetical protein
LRAAAQKGTWRVGDDPLIDDVIYCSQWECFPRTGGLDDQPQEWIELSSFYRTEQAKFEEARAKRKSREVQNY